MAFLKGLQNFDKDKMNSVETVVRAMPGAGASGTVIVDEGEAGTVASSSARQMVLVLSRNYMPFHSYLSPGCTRVLFTDEAAVPRFGPTIESFDRVETFKSYHTNGMVELRAQQMHAEVEFTHVVSLIEEDLLRAARIRENLGLPGPTVVDVLAYRDKVHMKEMLKAANVAVPTFGAVYTPGDLVAFVTTHGLPVVLKPRRGHSSIGTAIIRTEEDYEAALESMSTFCDAPLDLDVECFVEGPMYHCDGIVIGGVPRLIWPSRYLNFCADFRDNGFLASMSVAVDDPLRPRIQAFVAEVLQVLGGSEHFSFHCEVWHTPDDELVVCEIGCRTGGAEVRTQILELFDVELNKTYAQLLCADPVTNPLWDAAHLASAPSWQDLLPVVDYRVGWVVIYPKVGRVEAIPTTDDAEAVDDVLIYKPFADVGDTFESTEHCVDAVAHLLVKGRPETAEDDLMACVEWFEANTRYAASP